MSQKIWQSEFSRVSWEFSLSMPKFGSHKQIFLLSDDGKKSINELGRIEKKNLWNVYSLNIGAAYHRHHSRNSRVCFQNKHFKKSTFQICQNSSRWFRPGNLVATFSIPNMSGSSGPSPHLDVKKEDVKPLTSGERNSCIWFDLVKGFCKLIWDPRVWQAFLSIFSTLKAILTQDFFF